MIPSFSSMSSVKSGPPSPSAEGDWEPDLTLRTKGMYQEWRNEPGMMPMVIPRGSENSGPQSPSAEGDWGPDFTL